MSVGGLDWSARSEDGEIIEVDDKVLIKSIDGVKLIVEKIALRGTCACLLS